MTKTNIKIETYELIRNLFVLSTEKAQNFEIFAKIYLKTITWTTGLFEY